MTDEKDSSKKGRLRRSILDVLGAIGGLVALFQFFISDNVSSRWFKPARDWMAEAADLSEELRAFSGWWSEFTAPFIPGKIRFSDWLLLSIVVLLVVAGISVFYMGALFVTLVAEIKIGKADFSRIYCWLYAIMSVLNILGVYAIWLFSSAAAPLWVWVVLAAIFFTGIGVAVWDEIPKPIKEPSPNKSTPSKPKRGGSSEPGYGQPGYGQPGYGGRSGADLNPPRPGQWP